MTTDRGTADGSESSGDETLSDGFWAVARTLREAAHESLVPWAITPPHLRGRRVSPPPGRGRRSELSDHLHIAARSTTEVVDAIESRGLVQRRPDPGDRRATLVELTQHGESVLDAIRAARGSETERLFGRLSQTDQAHLARILRKLRN